jgi:tetratricopeptide (TPR) repeat protein
MRQFCVFIALLFSATAAQAGWSRADSRHFIAYSNGPAAELKADVERLERFDALVRLRSGIADDGGQVRLTVFFVRSVSAVQAIYDGKQADVAGFYTTSPTGALAVVPRTSSSMMDGDIILFHEYAHHVMMQYFTFPYPAWYVEGFAEFLSTTQFDKAGKPKLGLPAKHRAYGLFLGKDIPIRRLLTASVSDLSRAEGDPFYGRAWLATHYLSFSPERAGQLRTYLKSVGSGTAPQEAAQTVFGDLDRLDKDLDKYLNASRISYLQLANPIPVAGNGVTITALSEAEGKAMPVRIALMRGTLREKAELQAETMRKIAASAPKDAAVLTLLAEAEHDAHHYDAAIAAADAALATDPKSSNALLWKGSSMARKLFDAKDRDAAKWKSARAMLIRANRANPEAAAPLLQYYDSFGQEGVAAPDIAVDGLAKALSLVPQDRGIRFRYAFAMARKKDFVGAISVLQPLANSPHGGKATEAVRTLVARLKDAQAKGKAADVDALETDSQKAEDEGEDEKKFQP